ncbi:MAG: SRPBCC family protein, partial [Actinocatenispora sp.]
MIDIIQQLNVTTRRVAATSLGGGEAHAVTITRAYAAAPDDVWDACTTPERIARWFLPVSGDLRVGGRFQIEGNAGGTIERCDPPKGFSATWESGDSVGRIELRLSAEPDGTTRFELEHTVPVDDHWDQYGPGAVGVGWDLGLNGLVTHLATGDSLSQAEGAAWVASDEGRQFITLSGERWYDAHVAGGTDPAEARGAADRTTAAYTGQPEP